MGSERRSKSDGVSSSESSDVSDDDDGPDEILIPEPGTGVCDIDRMAHRIAKHHFLINITNHKFLTDSYIFLWSGQKPYKTVNDFATSDDYARYVRDNLRVGMLVKCKKEYEEVKSGDIGRVTKVGVASGRGL